MKKTRERYIVRDVIKFDLKMKLAMVFLLLFLFRINANTYSEKTKISIEVENVSIEYVLFEKIERQTDFKFFYENIVGLDKKVSIAVRNVQIERILSLIFNGTNIGYEILDKQIILSERKELSKKTGDGDIQSTIQGLVVDPNGFPLPGTNVVVKGTTSGTQTDFDGNYTISANENAILVFGYIGFETQEIPVNGQTTINVTMEEDSSQLNEVVVVGYGTQTRADLTGSVSSVDLSEAVKAPIVNVGEALEGRVTGVTLTNSGWPGSAPIIRIRGYGTTNGNNPLFIIDGVQTTDASIFNSINPGDIDQLNVLKDGTASIYGARAANGVIIVTTKSGSFNQKTSLSVDVYSGFSQAINLPELLNAQQHGEVIFESLRNAGVTPSHPQYGDGADPVVPSLIQGSPDGITAVVRPNGTDWFDEIFRTAQTQSVTASMESGSEYNRSLFSFSYLNRDGTQIFTGFKRGVLRVNNEYKIGERLRIGQHLNASFSQTQGSANQVDFAFRSSPLIPVFDEDGNFAGNYNGSTGLSNPENPVAVLTRARNNYSTSLRLFGDVYASLEILDGLTLKTSIGTDINENDGRFFTPLNPEYSERRSVNNLTETNSNSYQWVWNNTLTYDRIFGNHDINAVVGIEALETRIKGNGISVNDFVIESPDFYLLSTGIAPPTVTSAFDVRTSLYSLFGTVNYSYKSKYLLTATVRRDQTSRFGRSNQSGIFPSFSSGWVISNEDFFESDFIDRLKLRSSWGQLGNQSIGGGNQALNISSLNRGVFYPFAGSDSSVEPGARLVQVGNPDIDWETSETINVGVDLGLLDNKLSFSFDYFDITTEDLLARDNNLINITSIDANAPFVNLGSINNSGFEISAGYQNTTDSGFSYAVNVNFSRYRNEVEEIISEFFANGASRTQAGEPIASFYGRIVDGVFASDQEVTAHATQSGAAPGRFRYRDINEDGVINDDDRTFIGSPHPDFTYGININAGYKGFDLSALFSGTQGNDLYNAQKELTDFPRFFNGNRSVRVLDSWTPNNLDASLPALNSSVLNNELSPNTYFVEDGSFFRLKNLQLGYTLPKTIVEKIGINLRIYLQGSNLFTITGYDGLDPEIRTGGNALSIGIDRNTYPVSRIYTLGLNLKFQKKKNLSKRLKNEK